MTTILRHDVRELASIERLSEMPRLLQLIAARTATLANYSEFSRALGIPNSSLKRYLSLLEATLLVRQLPVWSAKLSKRLVRSPKIYVTDTGLAASLLKVTADDTASLVRGQLLETYIMNEIEKHRGWASIRTSLYQYRTHTGQDIGLVLEDRKGRVVGIEVKGKRTLKAADFRGLESLREGVGRGLWGCRWGEMVEFSFRESKQRRFSRWTRRVARKEKRAAFVQVCVPPKKESLH